MAHIPPSSWFLTTLIALYPFTPFFWADRKRWNWLSYGYLSDVGTIRFLFHRSIDWNIGIGIWVALLCICFPRSEFLSHGTCLSPSVASIGRINARSRLRSWYLGIWVMWVLPPTGVDQDSDKWPIHSPRFLYQHLSLFSLLFSGRMDYRSWLRYKISEWRGYLLQGFFSTLFQCSFLFPLFWPIGTNSHRNWLRY
jgi:hypothetical protein